jgi:glycosyltransferase involved in cell wall biosynthesis
MRLKRPRSRPIRIYHAGGPGDVAGTLSHWLAGRDDPSQVAMTSSGQFYDVCRDLSAAGLIVSSNPRRTDEVAGDIRVVQRPVPFRRGPAIPYHLTQLVQGLTHTYRALRFGADVAVIVDGTAHWFALALLPLLGVPVIPDFHCVIHSLGRRPRWSDRVLDRLNRYFFRWGVPVVLVMSEEIGRQVTTMCGGRPPPLVPFLATYRPGTFAGIAAPPASSPFVVLYAGRIERFKGVFDLLEIARGFAASGAGEIVFDLCGNGSNLAALRAAVATAGLEKTFRCHGHCDRTAMREMLGRCHVVIAPTRTDFAEGFNQVVVEAVLAGRPVITSRVCPSLSAVRAAAVEVEPDDVPGYARAILSLRDNPALYGERRAACEMLQAQFYDMERSWATALERALRLALGD